MENKKMCVWKRGGYFFIATLLGAGPFSSHVYAGTDHDQFNSVTTELNNGLNQKKSKKVTGTIVDETGEPVIGANVVQKGTTNGSITDIEGKFSLELPEDAVLEISYIACLGVMAFKNLELAGYLLVNDIVISFLAVYLYLKKKQ